MTAQLASSTSSSTNNQELSDHIRRRALERLYERRAAVNELITVLERYQDSQRRYIAPCIEITAARKCS